jgi:hypothetical protein
MLSRAFRPQTTTEDETPEPSLKKELEKEIIRSPAEQIFRRPFWKRISLHGIKLKRSKTLPKGKRTGVVHLDSPCGK